MFEGVCINSTKTCQYSHSNNNNEFYIQSSNFSFLLLLSCQKTKREQRGKNKICCPQDFLSLHWIVKMVKVQGQSKVLPNFWILNGKWKKCCLKQWFSIGGIYFLWATKTWFITICMFLNVVLHVKVGLLLTKFENHWFKESLIVL